MFSSLSSRHLQHKRYLLTCWLIKIQSVTHRAVRSELCRLSVVHHESFSSRIGVSSSYLPLWIVKQSTNGIYFLLFCLQSPPLTIETSSFDQIELFMIWTWNVSHPALVVVWYDGLLMWSVIAAATDIIYSVRPAHFVLLSLSLTILNSIWAERNRSVCGCVVSSHEMLFFCNTLNEQFHTSWKILI